MNIELFGCSGGMAEGFRRAGIEFDLVIDRDPDACSSYHANLGHRPLLGDVHDFCCGLLGTGEGPVTDAWLAGLEHRSAAVDLIVADPPCTPWSNAGKRRGLDDPNDCMMVTVEIIRLLRPRCYLIGNVPGLGNANNLDIQRKILAPLRDVGYCTADFRRLNAADYGVPQMRKRPFWFGHLGGPCLSWPIPTHADPRKLGLNVGLLPWVTCAQALAHLEPEEIGETVSLRWKEDSDHRPSKWHEPSKTETTNTHSDGALLMNSRHPPCEPHLPARTQTARASGGHAGAQLLTWPWDRPSTTVTTRTAIGASGHHENGGQFGPGSVKKLSERARAILQGFPAHWQFHGATQKSRCGQIGKAMPPPLAEAVARSMIDQMGKS